MAKFEWDEGKNKSNRAKHKVSFERGAETFDDPNGVFYVSGSKSEPRYIRVGKTTAKVLLAVVFTLRNTIVRIISVRSPRKREVKSYLENSLKQQHDESN
jgi:hypothetical protein